MLKITTSLVNAIIKYCDGLIPYCNGIMSEQSDSFIESEHGMNFDEAMEVLSVELEELCYTANTYILLLDLIRKEEKEYITTRFPFTAYLETTVTNMIGSLMKTLSSKNITQNEAMDIIATIIEEITIF